MKKPPTPSPLRAMIGATVSARLDANPAITRIATDKIDAFRYPDFLSDAECRTLVALIDKGRRPSTLLSAAHDPNFRTSESCDLERFAPEVRAIDERIAETLGIAPENGETMQGQRYAPGQQFRAHHDYFHQGEPYWEDVTRQGGQRTWTAMIFLNTVAEGGATWFPQAGMRAKPVKRMLLIWNNMGADGGPNPLTLHEGMAVVEGTKYIVTKWFREGIWYRVR
ncbi:prolyl 4-hydroxylase [Sphingomonas japonica]|uniref:Prolyl 4-hydroxylase n=1 Tax=Sphingomonas japonica TaxID=511662 RepID=A0ABX0TW43_9SPHN|nr:prolyl 4-hydroxylase [Sphingomonas japonica]